MRRIHLFGTLVLILLLAPTAVSAALLEYSFRNFYDTDRIVLTISPTEDYDNITFQDVAFEGSALLNGWNVETLGPATLALEGSAITAGTGDFDLTFSDNNFWTWIFGLDYLFDFSLQWDEYLNGSLAGQSTFEFENGVSQNPVPVPASAWLLLSGLALLVGQRRCRAE